MAWLIKKDSGEGIVCAVGKGRVIIAPIAPGVDAVQAGKKCAKPGCGSCGGCSSLVSVDGGYAGRFHIRVEDPRKYRPGDRVAFSRFVLEPNLLSALVFGVPVAFALAVMLCWFVYAPQSVESTAAIFSIAIAFFSGFFVLGAIDSLFKKKYPASIQHWQGSTMFLDGRAGVNPAPTDAAAPVGATLAVAHDNNELYENRGRQ